MIKVKASMGVSDVSGKTVAGKAPPQMVFSGDLRMQKGASGRARMSSEARRGAGRARTAACSPRGPGRLPAAPAAHPFCPLFPVPHPRPAHRARARAADVAELDEYKSDPSFRLTFPDEKNIRDAVCEIRPPEGLWRGACIKFSVKCEPTYPFQPPAVLCLTKLYHPNISLEGKVCLNILRVGHVGANGMDDGWKPVFTIYTVIMGFLTLFNAPDPTDPLNLGAFPARAAGFGGCASPLTPDRPSFFSLSLLSPQTPRRRCARATRSSRTMYAARSPAAPFASTSRTAPLARRARRL